MRGPDEVVCLLNQTWYDPPYLRIYSAGETSCQNIQHAQMSAKVEIWNSNPPHAILHRWDYKDRQKWELIWGRSVSLIYNETQEALLFEGGALYQVCSHLNLITNERKCFRALNSLCCPEFVSFGQFCSKCFSLTLNYFYSFVIVSHLWLLCGCFYCVGYFCDCSVDKRRRFPFQFGCRIPTTAHQSRRRWKSGCVSGSLDPWVNADYNHSH